MRPMYQMLQIQRLKFKSLESNKEAITNRKFDIFLLGTDGLLIMKNDFADTCARIQFMCHTAKSGNSTKTLVAKAIN